MAFNSSIFEPVVNPLLIVEAENGGLGPIPGPTTVNSLPSPLALQVLYTDAGVLFCPMTTNQRTDLSGTGLLPDGTEVYDITLHAKFIWANGAWDQLGGASDIVSLADGSAAAPSLSFASDPDTGLYRVSANQLGFSAGGVLQVKVTTTAAAVNFLDLTGGATGTNPILGAGGTDTNVGVDVEIKGAEALNIKGATNPGTIRFWNTANTFYTGFASQNAVSNIILNLPASLPTFGQAQLTIDALGDISCTSIGPQMYTQSSSMTAAQVRGMYATPIQILPAPGAGKCYVIHKVIFKTLTHTISYANGGSFGLEYSNVAHLAGTVITQTLAAADLFVVPAGGGIIVDMIGGGFSATITAAENSPVYLSNDTGAFTGGDGTMLLDVWYSILNTAS